MQRILVNSSDVVSVGYEPTQELMEVEFHGGRIYQYQAVPQTLYEQFMHADSYGQFLFAHVNGRYRYKKLDKSAGKNSAIVAVINFKPAEQAALLTVCEETEVPVETLRIVLDSIQSDDPEEIVTKKASAAYAQLGKPVLVSTMHWNILALKGFPGGYMSALKAWLSPQDVLMLLQDKTDRTIVSTKLIAYYDGKKTKLFSDTRQGRVLEESITNSSEGFEQLFDMNGADPEQSALWREVTRWLRLQQRLQRHG